MRGLGGTAALAAVIAGIRPADFGRVFRPCLRVNLGSIVWLIQAVPLSIVTSGRRCFVVLVRKNVGMGNGAVV